MKNTWKFLLLLQLFVITRVDAQSPVYDWGKRLLSSSTSGAICTAIAAEYAPPTVNVPATISNIYVTGNFNGTISIPELGTSISNTYGGYDIFILKISPAGLILNAQVIGSSQDDEANDICVQRNFNGTVTAVFVTGKLGGQFLLAKFNNNLTIPATNNIVTTAATPSGPANFAVGRGLAINGSTIYVAGFISGAVQMDFSDYLGGNTISVSTNISVAVPKELMVCSFNTNLQPIAGIVPYASGGESEAFDIAYGNSRLFITGYYRTSVQFSSNAASAIPSCSGYRDIFLANLNPNLAIGFDKTDQKQAGSNQVTDLAWYEKKDIGYSVAYASNAVYLAGGLCGGTTSYVNGAGPYNATGFMAKFPYTPATGTLGNVSYVCPMTNSTTPSEPMRPYGLTTDPDANVIVTGRANPGCQVYEANGVTNMAIPGATTADACGFICKFTSAGALLWAERNNQEVYNLTNTSTRCGQAVLASKCDLYHVGELSTTNQTTFGTNPPFTIAGSFNGSNAFVAKASNSMTMDGDTTVCLFGPNANFILSAGGASNYSWSVSPSSGVTITTTNSASPSVTITSPSTPSTYTFTCTSSVTYMNNQVCQQTGTLVVTIVDCHPRLASPGSAFSADVSVAPNPSADVFTIRWKNAERYDVELFDMTGKLVGTQQSTQETITINPGDAQLPYGIYLLKLTRPSGETHLEKIVYMRP